MRSKFFDVGLVVFLALAAVIVVVLNVPIPAVRFIVALPLVLILPGYALSTVVFVDNGEKVPTGHRVNTGTVTSKAVCTIGGSFVIAILGGFVLNATPWGLQANSWVILLAVFTLITASVGLARRGRSRVAIVEKSGPRMGTPQAFASGLAALLTVAAVTFSILGSSRHHTPGFTQFWIVPAANASQGAMHIGVTSRESRTEKFTVNVSQGNQLVREWPAFGLNPGETWTGMLVLPAGLNGTVEAHLYRLDQPGRVYRRVTLVSTQLSNSPSSRGVGGGQ
ncbi:MAG: hypothetical protein NVSMB52_15340 [Chloroflexota bacterium]